MAHDHRSIERSGIPSPINRFGTILVALALLSIGCILVVATRGAGGSWRLLGQHVVLPPALASAGFAIVWASSVLGGADDFTGRSLQPIVRQWSFERGFDAVRDELECFLDREGYRVDGLRGRGAATFGSRAAYYDSFVAEPVSVFARWEIDRRPRRRMPKLAIRLVGSDSKCLVHVDAGKVREGDRAEPRWSEWLERLENGARSPDVVAAASKRPPAPSGSGPEFERRVAELVIGLGGDVEVSVNGGKPVEVEKIEALPGIPAESIVEHPYRVTKVDLRWARKDAVENPLISKLCSLRGIRELFLESSRVTNEGLRGLGNLRALEMLSIDCEKVTDDGLQALGELTELLYLSLKGSKVTGRCLGLLRTDGKLRELHLEGAPVDDGGIEHLPAIESLGTLHLSGTEVTDRGLAHLAKLPGISLLYLKKTKIRGSGFAAFVGHRKLSHVELSDAPLEDLALKHLRQVSGLNWLELDGTGVTEEGIRHLQGLKLFRVNLQRTAVALSALRELRGSFRADGSLVFGDRFSWALSIGATVTIETIDGQQHELREPKDSERPLGSYKVIAMKFPNSSKLTNGDLEKLRGLTDLGLLDLSGTKITDEGLKHLAALSALRSVDLSGTSVSTEGIASLERSLPDCDVRK